MSILIPHRTSWYNLPDPREDRLARLAIRLIEVAILALVGATVVGLGLLAAIGG